MTQEQFTCRICNEPITKERLGHVGPQGSDPVHLNCCSVCHELSVNGEDLLRISEWLQNRSFFIVPFNKPQEDPLDFAVWR